MYQITFALSDNLTTMSTTNKKTTSTEMISLFPLSGYCETARQAWGSNYGQTAFLLNTT
jgi:hypothetical protein